MVFKLHSRLVLFNIIAIVLVTLLMGYYLGTSLRDVFESDIEDQLYSSATLAIGYMPVRPLHGNNIELANDIGRHLGMRVTIIDKDGKVLGDSELTPQGVASVENHSNRPEVMAALESGRGTSIRQSAGFGINYQLKRRWNLALTGGYDTLSGFGSTNQKYASVFAGTSIYRNIAKHLEWHTRFDFHHYTFDNTDYLRNSKVFSTGIVWTPGDILERLW